MQPAAQRQILHIDMDAFYAAIEQRDRPELRGRPVLVGGSPPGRGVVATASYEARPFGCRSAMPMAAAVRLCPQAVIVTPRFDRYSEVSRQIFMIMEQFTPLIEPLSIGEAFLDVTGSILLFGPAEQIAREIKHRIHEATELTASVGVAPNKFVAKLASDLRKPDGLVVVPQDEVQAMLGPLPIARLWGVGKATLPRFEQAGVHTFADAREMSESRLRELFGDAGVHFHQLIRGIDDRPVVPDRGAKSISHETTFAVDQCDPDVLRRVLLEQVEQVAQRLRSQQLLARCVVLKLRTPDFVTITRRTTLTDPSATTDTLWQAARSLFETWLSERRAPVRLIGAGVTQFRGRDGQQLALFDQAGEPRRQQLDQAVDAIRDRFGSDSIARGNRTRLGD